MRRREKVIYINIYRERENERKGVRKGGVERVRR